MTKIIFQANIDRSCIDVEDNGAAVIVEPDWSVTGADEKIFVRIQSYDEDFYDHPDYEPNNSKHENFQLGHTAIQTLFGKKVRVTVEVLE